MPSKPWVYGLLWDSLLHQSQYQVRYSAEMRPSAGFSLNFPSGTDPNGGCKAQHCHELLTPNDEPSDIFMLCVDNFHVPVLRGTE